MKRRFTTGGKPVRAGRALTLLATVLGGTILAGPAMAEHACDDLGATGWGTVATLETIAQSEGKPFRDEAAGNWYVERRTTVLPFCHYYNSIGNYSLRSYSLSPEERVERIEICHTEGPGKTAQVVAPYVGACPPS